MKPSITPRKSKLQLLHQYYKYTGFYGFLSTSLKKALLPILLFIGALLGVNYFIIDLNQVLVNITENYSSLVVLSIFFVSESILGLIPPEIFIAWSKKSVDPMLYLTILATLSYLGGVLSYIYGGLFTKIPKVHAFLEDKMAKHIKNTRKWGGFLIIVGALLPVPFSITSIAAGIIKFPLKSYLLFGLLRFARFYLYALAIFNIMQ